jgi:hypothetical protein
MGLRYQTKLMDEPATRAPMVKLTPQRRARIDATDGNLRPARGIPPSMRSPDL